MARTMTSVKTVTDPHKSSNSNYGEANLIFGMVQAHRYDDPVDSLMEEIWKIGTSKAYCYSQTLADDVVEHEF